MESDLLGLEAGGECSSLFPETFQTKVVGVETGRFLVLVDAMDYKHTEFVRNIRHPRKRI